MNKAELEEFRKRLLKMRQIILNGGLFNNSEDLQVSTDDLADEADLASNVIQQHVSFSIRNRELIKLRQIESALQRIEEGTYGMCEECDEAIEGQRLRNQPWTNLCIIHAEEREREHRQHYRIGVV